MGRFDKLPERLREAEKLVASDVDTGHWLWLSNLLEDAALKIEALQRET